VENYSVEFLREFAEKRGKKGRMSLSESPFATRADALHENRRRWSRRQKPTYQCRPCIWGTVGHHQHAGQRSNKFHHARRAQTSLRAITSEECTPRWVQTEAC